MIEITRETVREAVARAISARRGLIWNLMPSFSDHFCQGQNHEDLLAEADAALSALAARGLAVVPVEPTEAMVKAGNANRPYREDDGDEDLLTSNTECTWQAMLAASPLAKEPADE